MSIAQRLEIGLGFFCFDHFGLNEVFEWLGLGCAHGDFISNFGCGKLRLYEVAHIHSCLSVPTVDCVFVGRLLPVGFGTLGLILWDGGCRSGDLVVDLLFAFEDHLAGVVCGLEVFDGIVVHGVFCGLCSDCVLKLPLIFTRGKNYFQENHTPSSSKVKYALETSSTMPCLCFSGLRR